jgi:hypothetical protein
MSLSSTESAVHAAVPDTVSLQGERRSQERTVSVLINAGVAQGERNGLCRVRNLSDNGMMIETHIPLVVGHEASFQLRTGRTIVGSVRWSKDNRAGVALEKDGVEAVLSNRAHADAAAGGGAYPRFDRLSIATVISGAIRSRCELMVISLADAHLAGLPAGLPQGPVTVAIRGLEDRLARLVRIDENRVLASFAQPLNFHALEDWLDATMPATD